MISPPPTPTNPLSIPEAMPIARSKKTTYAVISIFINSG
jgi:hypothetical protein